jgi:hypothetical protein
VVVGMKSRDGLDRLFDMRRQNRRWRVRVIHGVNPLPHAAWQT